MEASNNKLTRFVEKDNDSGADSLGDSIKKYLYYWPLFVFCLLISLAVAVVYLHYSRPDYVVKAKVLLKSEGRSAVSDDNLSKIINRIISTHPSGRNLEDEIEIMKSREVTRRMVLDLGLWQSYSKKGHVVDEDLYGHSPVKLSFVSKPDFRKLSTVSIELVDDNYFDLLLSNGDHRRLAFGQLLQSPMGAMMIEKTASFERYVGRVIKIGMADPETVAYNLRSKIKVEEANKDASVVQLSVEESNLDRGKDILNSMIKEYNITSQMQKDNMAANALKFIDDRLASLSGELSSVEMQVEGFRKDRGLTDISSEAQIYLDNVKNNDSRLNEVDVQLSVIKGIESFANNPDIADAPIPSTVGLSDPALVTLVTKLIDQQLQYKQLMGTLPEKNPAFEPIRQQIAATRVAIRDNIQTMKGSLQSTRNRLNVFNSRFEGAIRTIPGDERQLVSIKRKQGIKESLYVYLLQKREEAGVSYASNLSGSMIIDGAYLDSLKKPLTYSIAILIGLLIPTFLLFLRELFNNKVTSMDQIERLGLPVACQLVYEPSRKPLVVKNKKHYAIGEQFRALRTDLNYIHAGKKNSRVTLVTSSIAGEGKSFIVSNLGVTLAASGRRTLVLEFDMRKPRISSIFDLPNQAGLNEYLNNRASLSDIIHESAEQPGLFFIGTGSIPENPSELLERPEVDEMFALLRSEFDDILVDTPPISLITDAMLLSRIADASIYVVRQGVSFKKHLDFIKKISKDEKLPNLKVVFNGVKPRGADSYGYGYYGTFEKSKRVSLANFVRSFSSRMLLSS